MSRPPNIFVEAAWGAGDGSLDTLLCAALAKVDAAKAVLVAEQASLLVFYRDILYESC